MIITDADLRAEGRQRAAALGITMTPEEESAYVAAGRANVERFDALMPACAALGEACAAGVEEAMWRALKGEEHA